MDNISSSRIEPLGPGAERDTEPPPRNTKKKVRVAAEQEIPPEELAENLELTAEPDERHHLDERA